MKFKITFLLFFIVISQGFSQVWLDIGAKGMFNSTWLFNSNVNHGTYSTYDFSWGKAGGARVGLNFTEKHAIGTELLFSQSSQNIVSSGITNGDWRRKTTLNYIDIPLLYRKTGEGSYFEIGPQYSIFKSSTEVFNPNLKYSNTTVAPYNVSSNNSFSNHLGVLMGFGSNLFSIGENLYISLGMRFTYSFADITSDAGGKGQDVMVYKTDKIDFAPYKSTHLFTAGFVLEINYDLGYMVSATCGRKEFLFF